MTTDIAVIPIFPLNIVVLPGEPVPLHIFEPRYKQLIADCAPLPGAKQYQPFGISYSKKNQLSEIGCTVIVDEILHKYPAGELDIMTFGQQRYKLLDTYRDKVYMTAEIEWFREPDEELDADARGAVMALYEQFLSVVEVSDMTIDARSTHLSYEVAYRVNLEKGPKLELLEAPGENARLHLLRGYLEEAVPQIEKAKEFRRIVRGNGYFV